MGVNTAISLPPATRLRDAAHVIGIAAGLTFRLEPIGGPRDGAWHVVVPDIRVEGCQTLPECATIDWSRAVDVAIIARGRVLWHHEFDRGRRGLLPSSTAFWICVGQRLVDAFGGHVDYVDDDDHPIDYFRDAPPCLGAEDGAPWQELQARVAATRPITPDDLRAAESLAAYKGVEMA